MEDKLDVAVGRTDWDGLEDGFAKALFLIHWGN